MKALIASASTEKEREIEAKRREKGRHTILMRKQYRVFYTIMLLLVTALWLVGCASKEQEGVLSGAVQVDPADEISLHEVSLPYRRSAGLNPLELTDLTNFALCSLLYDPLVALDAAYRAQPALASEVMISGRVVTITLRDDVYFHNGRKLTAEDVYYTLDSVRRKEGYYTARMRNVEVMDLIDAHTVRLILKEENALFEALLNIPIIPARAAAEVFEPVGTGRYVYYAAEEKLFANTDWFGGDIALQHITLVEAPDAQAVAFAFQTGQIQLAVEPSAETQGSRKTYVTSSLVLLGVNPSCAALSTPMLRQALAAGISRAQLLDDNIARGGYIALSPLNPRWYLYDASSIARGYDPAFTESALIRAGYTERDSENYLAMQTGGGRLRRLSVRLVCNGGNAERSGIASSIANQLRTYGYEVTVVEVPTADFLPTIARGAFDLYLGEVRLTPDMDIEQLVGTGGSLNYGGFSSHTVDRAITQLKATATTNRTAAAAQLIAALDEEVPVVALYYALGEIVLNPYLIQYIAPYHADPLSGLTNIVLQAVDSAGE